MLDLRFLSLGANNIASFARKADAIAAAKASQGKWAPSDVFRAYNRFCIFWVIGQVFGDLRLLTRDGRTTTIQFPTDVNTGA